MWGKSGLNVARVRKNVAVDRHVASSSSHFVLAGLGQNRLKIALLPHFGSFSHRTEPTI
jgi:hypothetical protein